MIICYHGTDIEGSFYIQKDGIKHGTFVSTEFEWAVYYALMRFDSDCRVLEIEASVEKPTEMAFDEERITTGEAIVKAVYAPRFTALPDDWMEPNDAITGHKYPELFNPEQWLEIERD